MGPSRGYDEAMATLLAISLSAVAWLQLPEPVHAHAFIDECSTSPTEDARVAEIARLNRRKSRDRQAAGTLDVSEVGGLIVIEDDGRFTTHYQSSEWDLSDSALVFEPAETAGYFLGRLSAATRPVPGAVIEEWEGTWGTVAYPLPFEFPFGTAVFDTVHLTSDLGLFFDEPDGQAGGAYQFHQSDVDLALPRISPLLRPEPWGWAGRIVLHAAADSDAVTFTWHERTDRPDSNIHLDRLFHLRIEAGGRIVMSYPDALPINTFGYVQVVAPGPEEAPGSPLDLTDLSSLSSEHGTLLRYAHEAFTLPGLDISAVFDEVVDRYGLTDDNLDGLMVYQTFYTDIAFYAGAFHTRGRPGVTGIGRDGPLRTSLMHMNQIDLSWNLRSNESMVSVLSHEFGHRWLYYVDGVGPSRSGAHPSQNAHLPADVTLHTATDSSCMGGGYWTESSPGIFTSPPFRTYFGYSSSELYLLGLAAPQEVEPWWYIDDNAVLNAPYYPPLDGAFEGVREDLVIDDIIAEMGLREPAYPDTQRDFNVAFVLLSRPQDPADFDALANVRHKMNIWSYYWGRSVNGRATLHTEHPEILGNAMPDCNFNGVDDAIDVQSPEWPDVNADGTPDACDSFLLIAASPLDHAVDVRQPHDPAGGPSQSWSTLRWRISADVDVQPEQFEVTQVGGAQPAPEVVAVNDAVDGELGLMLSEPINAGAWTTVRFIPGGTQSRMGHLPGDVNGDHISTVLDILTMVDGLNGIATLTSEQLDINRSGVVEPSDILRLIDLLNGAGAFEPWLGRELPGP
jgi:hypothetical protein